MGFDGLAFLPSYGIGSPAVNILKRHGAASILVDEAQLLAATAALRDADGPQTTPSGAAGVAGLLRCAEDPALRTAHALSEDSRVLLIATERPPA